MSHALSTLFICPHLQHTEHLMQWLGTYGTALDWQLPAQHENDAQTPLTIEQVRAIQANFSYTASTAAGMTEVHCIERIERSSLPAQNALLKLAEEPPKNRVLVFSATDINSIIPTLVSRCHIEYCKQSSTQTANLSTIILRLLDQSNSVTYTEIIEFCSGFSDKEAGLTFAQETLNFLHQNMYKDIDVVQKTTAALRALTQLQSDLLANVNIKLAMEECLLKMKR